MLVFFDIETTGLSKSSDILEFAAIICSEDLQITKIVNNYYLYDIEVPSGASQVNGLTRQKLEFLADTDFITDAKNIFTLLADPSATIVGHNILSYDLPVVYNNLHRAGLELSVPESRCIDTLLLSRQHYSGKHDLQSSLYKVLAEHSISLEYVKSVFANAEVFKPYIKDTKMTFHSGLFDAFITYILFLAWKA